MIVFWKMSTNYKRVLLGLFLLACLCTTAVADSFGSNNNDREAENVPAQWQQIINKNLQRDHARKIFSMGFIALCSSGLLLLALACCYYISGPLKAQKITFLLLGASPPLALWYFGLAGFLAAIAIILLLCFVVWFNSNLAVWLWGKTPKSRRWPGVLLSFGSICLITGIGVLLAWDVPNLVFWDRNSQSIKKEYSSTLVKKIQSLLYSHPLITKVLAPQPLLELYTQACGYNYTKPLQTNEQKKKHLKEAFIDPLQIDMSVYRKPSYLDYGSVNQWFARKISMDARPVAQAKDDTVIVSPADGKLSVVYDDNFLVKHHTMSIKSLLGDPLFYGQFDNPFAIIVRLSPQDYHRFHYPISGKILHTKRINAKLHSVSRDAMVLDTDILGGNSRHITIIDSPRLGPVAYIAVGAVCVGSIQIGASAGDTALKGQEHGYFQFGGSTVVLIMNKNRVKIDKDLEAASKLGVETFVTVGSKIATQQK